MRLAISSAHLGLARLAAEPDRIGRHDLTLPVRSAFRARAGGKDQVDHPRGQHNDYGNVLALRKLSARGSPRLRFGRVLRCTRRNIRVDFEHYPNFRADKTGEVGDHLIGDTIGVSLASA